MLKKHILTQLRTCKIIPISFGKLIILIGLAAFAGCSNFAPQHDASPTTWKAFDDQAKPLAEQVSFLAAEITDGNCATVYAIDPDKTLGVGSSFKLYILAELADQIAASNDRVRTQIGEGGQAITWDTLLPIRDSFKAIPHGALLYVPDDTYFTVRYFAEQMIQRSDNTATDHLIFLLGRKNIERRLAESGHHDPMLNIPLMATREFAILKFLYSDSELSDYLAAATEKKRAILNNEQRGYQQLELYFEQNGDQQKPVRIDSVEWFADRFDMCKLLLSLNDLAKANKLRPVTEILSLEDQLDIDREQWPYVGFKGGSELGVLAGNWLLQRNDGRLFVLTFALNNPAEGIDMSKVVPLFKSAVDLLYQTP